MKTMKLKNTETITVLCYEKGELNPSLYGEHNAVQMTVGEALRRDSMGRTQWSDCRGTLVVQIRLADMSEFEKRNGVKLFSGRVFLGKDARPYVQLKNEWEDTERCYHGEFLKEDCPYCAEETGMTLPRPRVECVEVDGE